MEHLQRTRLLSFAILGVVLVSGVLLGLALDVGLDEEVPQEPADASEQARDGSREDDDRRDRRTPIYRQVGALTADQEVRIEAIIEVQRDSLRELRRDFDDFRDRYNSRYLEIVEGTRGAIKGVLTADQVLKYDSLVAEYRSRRRDDDSNERRK